MIVDIDIGSSAAYPLVDRTARVLGGTLIGRTYDEITAEVEAFWALHPEAPREVAHIKVSLAPGERLGSQQFVDVADEIMRALGYARALYVIIAHDDTALAHLHVVSTTVDLHGKGVSRSHDRYRAQAARRTLEDRYGLRRTPTAWDHAGTTFNRSWPEMVRIMAGERPLWESLSQRAGLALRLATGWAELSEHLVEAGLTLHYTGRGLAVSTGSAGVGISKLVPGLSAVTLAIRYGETYEQYELRRQSPTPSTEPDPPAIALASAGPHLPGASDRQERQSSRTRKRAYRGGDHPPDGAPERIALESRSHQPEDAEGGRAQDLAIRRMRRHRRADDVGSHTLREPDLDARRRGQGGPGDGSLREGYPAGDERGGTGDALQAAPPEPIGRTPIEQISTMLQQLEVAEAARAAAKEAERALNDALEAQHHARETSLRLDKQLRSRSDAPVTTRGLLDRTHEADPTAARAIALDLEVLNEWDRYVTAETVRPTELDVEQLRATHRRRIGDVAALPVNDVGSLRAGILRLAATLSPSERLRLSQPAREQVTSLEQRQAHHRKGLGLG